MWSIYRKEINSFFSSLIGYIAIVVFLLVTGFVVWVFPDTNILDYGYATLDPLFIVAPWVFMLLIPAVTMRSFSEEISSGTIELLTTKPISELGIILGKYLASLTLVVFALVPTVLYYFTVYQLGYPVGNLDTGGIIGSYIGLMLLSASFVAIGIFASSISSNQIVAFILAAVLCAFLFEAFTQLSQLDIFYAKLDVFVEGLGIHSHYMSISRGVVDTRDLLYFLSLITLFILFTKTSLESRKW